MRMIREAHLFVLLGTFLLPSVLLASGIDEVLIALTSEDVEVGEPVFVTIHVTYGEPPQGSTRSEVRTGRPAQGTRETVLLDITHKDETEPVNPWGLSSGVGFARNDTEGKQYISRLPVYYDFTRYKKELPDPPERAFYFSEPGQYQLRIVIRGVMSNLLVLKVRPSSADTKAAIALLDRPMDFAYLITSDLDKEFEKDSDAKERFQAIVDQCPSSVVATYASVRLGMLRFREVMEKYNTEGRGRFRACYGSLKQGLQLPVSSCIREESLLTLIKAELIAGDNDQAAEHVKVLVQDYGDGPNKMQIEKLKAEIAGIRKKQDK